MGNWKIEHSAESKAPPASVWERYTDVDQWREWSKGVEDSSLEGEFENGSKGKVKPPQLPKSSFELVDVEPERRFTTQTKFPVGTGKLRIEHEVEASNGGSRITHRATIDGPLDFVWSRAVGWIVKRELPGSVEQLAELAVEKAERARKQEEEQEQRKERLHEADEHFKEEIERTAPKDGEDSGAPSLPGG